MALEESKRFLRATLNALSAHIAILDEDGWIIEVNDAWKNFARTNGFSGSNFGIGTNYFQLRDTATGNRANDAREIVSGIRKVILGQIPEFYLEYPCHGPNELRWFVFRATRFPADGPIHIVLAHNNITERKVAERRIVENEQKMRAILGAASDAIVTINYQGSFKA